MFLSSRTTALSENSHNRKRNCSPVSEVSPHGNRNEIVNSVRATAWMCRAHSGNSFANETSAVSDCPFSLYLSLSFSLPRAYGFPYASPRTIR